MSTINRKLSVTFTVPLFIIAFFAIAGIYTMGRTSATRASQTIFSSMLESNSRYISDWVGENIKYVKNYAELVNSDKLKVNTLSDARLSATANSTPRSQIRMNCRKAAMNRESVTGIQMR